MLKTSPRAEVGAGVAVAVEAPAHRQRLVLPGQRHPIDPAVALDAADPLGDVDVVVEVDEARAGCEPASSGAALPVFQLSRTGASVSAPTQICSWQFMHVSVGGIPANAGLIDRLVAVAAVDPELADVVCVAERHRLLVGRPGRPSRNPIGRRSPARPRRRARGARRQRSPRGRACRTSAGKSASMDRPPSFTGRPLAASNPRRVRSQFRHRSPPPSRPPRSLRDPFRSLPRVPIPTPTAPRMGPKGNHQQTARLTRPNTIAPAASQFTES